MLLVSVPSFAQDCVTKFMGIPVDGTKKEMFSALEKKGFKKVDGDMLVGEFNGKESLISIETYKGKVSSIVVSYDANSGLLDESMARMTFNTLFLNFSNNPKYVYYLGKMILDGEDVELEMLINKKTYNACFFQVGDCPDEFTKRLVIFLMRRISYNQFTIAIGYCNSNNTAKGEDL